MAYLLANRRRLLILGIVVIFATSILTVLIRTTPPPVEVRSLFSVGMWHTPSAAETESIRFRYTEAIKKDAVLLAALEQPEVADLELIKRQADPVAWLKLNLRVKVEPLSDLVEVSLAGDNKDEITVILGAVTDAYVKDVAKRKEDERPRLEQRKQVRLEYRDRKVHLLETLRKRQRAEPPLAAQEVEELLKTLESLDATIRNLNREIEYLDVEILSTPRIMVLERAEVVDQSNPVNQGAAFVRRLLPGWF